MFYVASQAPFCGVQAPGCSSTAGAAFLPPDGPAALGKGHSRLPPVPRSVDPNRHPQRRQAGAGKFRPALFPGRPNNCLPCRQCLPTTLPRCTGGLGRQRRHGRQLVSNNTQSTGLNAPRTPLDREARHPPIMHSAAQAGLEDRLTPGASLWQRFPRSYAACVSRRFSLRIL